MVIIGHCVSYQGARNDINDNDDDKDNKDNNYNTVKPLV